MPFIFPGLLGSSIFLYGSERDATDGANWGGSGVLVGVPSRANPSRTHLYAVSNDHVTVACPVIRLVRGDGNPFVLPGTADDWEPHPNGDDVAIRYLGAVAAHEYWYVESDLLLTEADLNPDERPYQIGPGDDCIMVGRYINQDFKQFDRPVVRFGNLAMLPELVYQDKRSFDQLSFLVDMRSHSGFSGSPVFVYYEAEGWRFLPPEPERPPEIEVDGLEGQELVDALQRRADAAGEYRDALSQRTAGYDVSGVMGKRWLLGLDWGHLPIWDDVYDGNQKIGRMRVSTGMAAVVPAWKLTELLAKEMKMERDKVEEELAKTNEGGAVMDSAEESQFDRFEDLAKKLVQVPKKELDEKRKAGD